MFAVNELRGASQRTAEGQRHGRTPGGRFGYRAARMGHQPRMGETLVALARPVLGSMAVSVVGLILARQLLPAGFAGSNDVVGNYLQTLGSIYAVLLAFVVFVVWTQFNDARGYVERESNEVLDLYRAVRGLPEPTRGRITAQARSYLQIVLEVEWKTLGSDRPLDADRGAAVIDEMWQSVHAAEPQAETEQSSYREVLKRLDDVSDARSNRLNSSRLKIPQALRVLLYTGALSVVGSMYLLDVHSLALHAIITAALAGSVANVLFVVEDLDNCFKGHWRVPRTPFERVQLQIAEKS